MGLCKKDVTPLLTHRSYVFLALPHRYILLLTSYHRCGKVHYLSKKSKSRWIIYVMMTSSNGNIFRVTGYLCGKFPTQRPVTRSFAIFFDLRLNKRLSKQSWSWWFETLLFPLWRQCNWLLYYTGRFYTHSLELCTDFPSMDYCNSNTNVALEKTEDGSILYIWKFITVTSWWARLRLKSPAYQLFTQPFVQAQTEENIISAASLAFVRGIHRWTVNSPQKSPVTRKMFPFDDVIIRYDEMVCIRTPKCVLFKT